MPEAILSMGRKKIVIERIIDRRRKKATFDKRKKGILKKAHELAVLTGSTVSLSIRNDDVSEDHVFSELADAAALLPSIEDAVLDPNVIPSSPVSEIGGRLDLAPVNADPFEPAALTDDAMVPWMPSGLVQDLGTASPCVEPLDACNMELSTFGDRSFFDQAKDDFDKYLDSFSCSSDSLAQFTTLLMPGWPSLDTF